MERRCNELEKETSQLKHRLAAKESEAEQLDSQLEREKSRRESDTKELRFQLEKTQERVVEASKDAERWKTEHKGFKETSERNQRIVDKKDDQVDSLKAEIDKLKRDLLEHSKKSNQMLAKEKLVWEEEQKDKFKSYEIKLNQKEHTIDRLERLMIEL